MSLYKIVAVVVFSYVTHADKSPELEANLTVSKDYEGWLSIRITNAANYWAVNRTENLGLYMRVTDLKMGQEIDPYKSGIVGQDGPKNKQLLLTVFFKMPNLEQRQKLSATEEKSTKLYQREVGEYRSCHSNTFLYEHRNRPLCRGMLNTVFQRVKFADRLKINIENSYQMVHVLICPFATTKSARQQQENEACQRLPLYVDFESIGWTWIDAPKEYNALYCGGDCSYASVDQNFHAVVQSLVHLLIPQSVNNPCCVPTTTSDLDLVYYVGRNATKLRLKDMVVEECGCLWQHKFVPDQIVWSNNSLS